MVTKDELDQAIRQMKRFIFSLIQGVPRGIEIEDVYQDLMLAITSACYSRYDSKRSKLTSFVGEVARWRMAELYRAWSKEKKTIEFREELVCTEAEVVVPYARDVIWEMSKDLPPKQRMVIRNVADGMTEEEIGKRLGITRQAVNLLLYRGIKTIREHYTWEW